MQPSGARQKRGGGAPNVTLDEEALGAGEEVELLDLSEGIAELEKVDERKSQLIELQYFVGLTFEEMAEMTGLSTSTLGPRTTPRSCLAEGLSAKRLIKTALLLPPIPAPTPARILVKLRSDPR